MSVYLSQAGAFCSKKFVLPSTYIHDICPFVLLPSWTHMTDWSTIDIGGSGQCHCPGGKGRNSTHHHTYKNICIYVYVCVYIYIYIYRIHYFYINFCIYHSAYHSFWYSTVALFSVAGVPLFCLVHVPESCVLLLFFVKSVYLSVYSNSLPIALLTFQRMRRTMSWRLCQCSDGCTLTVTRIAKLQPWCIRIIITCCVWAASSSLVWVSYCHTNSKPSTHPTTFIQLDTRL